MSWEGHLGQATGQVWRCFRRAVLSISFQGWYSWPGLLGRMDDCNLNNIDPESVLTSRGPWVYIFPNTVRRVSLQGIFAKGSNLRTFLSYIYLIVWPSIEGIFS